MKHGLENNWKFDSTACILCQKEILSNIQPNPKVNVCNNCYVVGAIKLHCGHNICFLCISMYFFIICRSLKLYLEKKSDSIKCNMCSYEIPPELWKKADPTLYEQITKGTK